MRIMLGKKHPYNRSMFRGMGRALSFLAGHPFPATMADKGQSFQSTMAHRENKISQTMFTKAGGGREAKSPDGSKEENPVAPIKTEVKITSVPAKPMTAEEAEEKRLREIDEIAQAINDDNLVRKAKYGDMHKGIFPHSASDLALKALQKKAQDIAYRDIDIGVAAMKQSAK